MKIRVENAECPPEFRLHHLHLVYPVSSSVRVCVRSVVRASRDDRYSVVLLMKITKGK
jgi:hypothetical protein